MIGLAIFAPGPALLPDAWPLAGLLPIGAGIALNVAAVVAFRRAHTTTRPDGRPNALVRNGVYRLVRNPMYLGGALILAGFALLLDAAPALLVPPAYAILASRGFIPPEEQKLAATFGEDWRTYARRTPRGL